jgi:uncharacterized protein YndB with AHSA1/START domain
MTTQTTTVQSRHGSATVSLPSELEIVITRHFDAPAALLFKAHTTPELLRRWWGFETYEWLVCDIDLRVGGQWRCLTRSASGNEVGFHGEYREIGAPHRLVNTEVYEGISDSDEGSLNTITFEEHGGVTTRTETCVYASQEVRDAVIAYGMEEGMQVSFNRLEDLLTGQSQTA